MFVVLLLDKKNVNIRYYINVKSVICLLVIKVILFYQIYDPLIYKNTNRWKRNLKIISFDLSICVKKNYKYD